MTEGQSCLNITILTAVISESLTSREHDECVLQHLVSFVFFFVTFFRIHIFLLTEMEMAKCSGECKVWQLGQISVLLKHKYKPFLYHTEKLTLTCMHMHTRTHAYAHFTSQSWYNWRRDWYSLERSVRKSMSRSMQSGSESGSKLIREADETTTK